MDKPSTPDSMQQVMRTIRSGTVSALMETLDSIPSGMVDAERNTPLHAVLLNPSVNGSAKLLDALVAEFVSLGVDPLAQNAKGQTARQLAEDMVAASNISDGQYGAINTVILRLGEMEKQLQPEKAPRTGIEKPQPPTQNESWVQTVLRDRQHSIEQAR